MRSVAATLLLIGSALAAGGADGVNSVLTSIASDLKEFDAAIKAYSGGSDVAGLTSASKKIEGTTSAGAQSISSGPELSLTDAVGITSNVQTLQTTLDATLADLKGISEKLASAGQCSTILEQLASQSKSAQALQDAITGKAPAETKAVAAQLGGAIGASIDDTNSYFKKACANAPSGGAAGGASSKPAPASSGSAPSSGGAPSAGGAPAPAAGGASPASPAAGAAGSKTDKTSKTAAPAKPATYTGAGSSISVPILGALALAFFAL